MSGRLTRNNTLWHKVWQSDRQFLSLFLSLSTGLLPHWTAATTKENFCKTEAEVNWEFDLNGRRWKVKMTQKLPHNALTASLTTSLVSAGWWEDQPFYVWTLYYSLANCNSLASSVSPPSSQAFQWLDSKTLQTFSFTVWCCLWWPDPHYGRAAGWLICFSHIYGWSRMEVSLLSLNCCKMPRQPMIKQHSRVFVPFWCQESGNWELLWCGTYWGAPGGTNTSS